MHSEEVVAALGEPRHRGEVGAWTSLIYDDGANHPYPKHGSNTLLMIAFDQSGVIRGWIIVEGDDTAEAYFVLEGSGLFPGPESLTALDQTLKTHTNYFAFYTSHLISYEVKKYQSYWPPITGPPADSSETDVPNAQNRGGTPLHLAVANGQKDEVAKLLLAHAADVNVKDSQENTPLHWAALWGRTDIAKLLLEHGADVNAENHYGQTPLDFAAYEGNKDVAELLLEHGADVNAKPRLGDRSWSTPLYTALHRHHEDVAKLLRQHGGHE